MIFADSGDIYGVWLEIVKDLIETNELPIDVIACKPRDIRNKIEELQADNKKIACVILPGKDFSLCVTPQILEAIKGAGGTPVILTGNPDGVPDPLAANIPKISKGKKGVSEKLMKLFQNL